MTPEPKCLVIHTSDVIRICRISERSAQRLLERVRKHFNRATCPFVSMEDFCAFTGLKEDRVQQFLR